MNVGCIGLGSMGAAMAALLLERGTAVHVWNRSPDKAEPLAAAGAVVATSPLELATCDAIVVMLANDAAVRAAIVDSGLLAKMGPPAVIVNCSTISPQSAREMSEACAARGVGYVAAPVLGRPDAARAGELNVLVAGAPAARERVAPLLEILGKKTWLFGDDPVHANVAKIATNFLIASAIESLGEAFGIAEGNGVAPAALLDLVANTLFAAPVYKNYGASIVAKKFEPAGFALELGLKDVDLARAAGKAGGARLLIGDALHAAFSEAVVAGDGKRDWSAVADRVRRPVASTT